MKPCQLQTCCMIVTTWKQGCYSNLVATMLQPCFFRMGALGSSYRRDLICSNVIISFMNRRGTLHQNNHLHLFQTTHLYLFQASRQAGASHCHTLVPTFMSYVGCQWMASDTVYMYIHASSNDLHCTCIPRIRVEHFGQANIPHWVDQYSASTPLWTPFHWGRPDMRSQMPTKREPWIISKHACL